LIRKKSFKAGICLSYIEKEAENKNERGEKFQTINVEKYGNPAQ